MGKLFVIEGLDGSGKETQSNLLYEKLLKDGHKVMIISYPRYNRESSSLVKMYLRGDFGKNPDEVSPYVSSTFYAVDRYASFKCELESFYHSGGIIIADRYTTSNMVHQGGKISDEDELSTFLDWLWNLEFTLYKIPIPDKVYFLYTPLEHILNRIEKRVNKITKDIKKDIHEDNYEHLKHAFMNADKLVKMYNWKKVQCFDENRCRTIEEINQEIYTDIIKLIEEVE